MFNLGDGNDIISDTNGNGTIDAGNDTLRFGEGIFEDDVAIFLNVDGELEVSFSANEFLKVQNQTNVNTAIENIELSNSASLDSVDINSIIQQISNYAINEGVTFDSVDDVKENNEVMAIIGSHWE